jgi:hypothetical protein
VSTIHDAPHTLVVYGGSSRAEAVLRSLAEAAAEEAARVTVISLAIQERASRGCCDTRSVLWNGICRDLAREELSKASLAVADNEVVALDMVAFPAGRGADTVIQEALSREADEIVLVEPRASGLGRLERRRLRRRSPVPVTDYRRGTGRFGRLGH